MSYRYDILSKTTLCTAVFYTVQTEQAGDFLGPGRNDSGSKTSAGQYDNYWFRGCIFLSPRK